MKRLPKITEDRILQISNNVSEEYVDLGETDFATKREFCEVVRYWQRKELEAQEKYSALKSKIGTLWLQEMNGPPKRKTRTPLTTKTKPDDR